MIPRGPILAFATVKAGELLEQTASSFRTATRKPLAGPPHTPARVRVSSTELAEAVRAAIPPGTEVVRAPTPELDELAATMRDHLDAHSDHLPSYLAPDIGADAIAAFFRAAAGMFRARPWAVIPRAEDLLSVTIDSLGVQEAAVCIVGQMGQALGLMLFSGLEDFEAYSEAADAVERGETPVMAPHFCFNFERAADLPASLRKEVAAHGWEVRWRSCVLSRRVPRSHRPASGTSTNGAR